jgi:hypothetical protein
MGGTIDGWTSGGEFSFDHPRSETRNGVYAGGLPPIQAVGWDKPLVVHPVPDIMVFAVPSPLPLEVTVDDPDVAPKGEVKTIFGTTAITPTPARASSLTWRVTDTVAPAWVARNQGEVDDARFGFLSEGILLGICASIFLFGIQLLVTAQPSTQEGESLSVPRKRG